MPDFDLEQVKKLAEQLSPDERQELFTFIAKLPNSGLFALEPPPVNQNLDGAQETAYANSDGDAYVVIATSRMARLLLKGRIVFDVAYYPENLWESRMEIRSWKDAPISGRAAEYVVGVLRLYGSTEEDIKKLDFDAMGKEVHLQLFQALNYRITAEISKRLSDMTSLLFDAGIKIVELGVLNDYREKTGQPKRPLDELVKELEPYWKHIKAHLGVSSGGRRITKHAWTVLDHTCLALHYERLKPIWREAKKTAKEAQNAKELTRRKRWREAVTAVYQEEELPVDLVEQLAMPQAAPPADLALIHAASICLPGTSYSLKILKEKLRQMRPPPPKPPAEPPS